MALINTHNPFLLIKQSHTTPFIALTNTPIQHIPPIPLPSSILNPPSPSSSHTATYHECSAPTDSTSSSSSPPAPGPASTSQSIPNPTLGCSHVNTTFFSSELIRHLNSPSRAPWIKNGSICASVPSLAPTSASSTRHTAWISSKRSTRSPVGRANTASSTANSATFSSTPFSFPLKLPYNNTLPS